MTLAQRLLALHSALARAGLPHAFGGAIALAYWTLEPRGTRDLDVNVFVPAGEWEQVLAAMPAGVTAPEGARERLAAEGQARLWWDDVPVDLFLDYAPIHLVAAERAREVPFEGELIPVLDPAVLATFKTMFDRTRDWADIEAMLAAGTITAAQVRALAAPMLDAADPRLARLEAAAGRARPA